MRVARRSVGWRALNDLRRANVGTYMRGVVMMVIGRDA
ncbi:hypothetical protein PAMC26577_28510 [Caballeronia sordidicola]|uniref:Uncharacterized protein n=1 Tax=Caballeronia sordidicola TaxID=196367 RepID=A0A242MG36_CABSO|nr:hypothetical protein PAMC26577_28510 [Caballeronia sordidicola]